ncbi:hypothetical protein JHW43_004740 [Diplocarpon mali]|nr:hypothetical protein JHW43_004740 [Diplocarpon mali]
MQLLSSYVIIARLTTRHERDLTGMGARWSVCTTPVPSDLRYPLCSCSRALEIVVHVPLSGLLRRSPAKDALSQAGCSAVRIMANGDPPVCPYFTSHSSAIYQIRRSGAADVPSQLRPTLPRSRFRSLMQGRQFRSSGPWPGANSLGGYQIKRASIDWRSEAQRGWRAGQAGTTDNTKSKLAERLELPHSAIWL